MFFIGETNILRRFYEHKGNVPTTIPAVDGHSDILLGMIHNPQLRIDSEWRGFDHPRSKAKFHDSYTTEN